MSLALQLQQGLDPMIYAQLALSFGGGIVGGFISVMAYIGLRTLHDHWKRRQYVRRRQRAYHDDGND